MLFCCKYLCHEAVTDEVKIKIIVNAEKVFNNEFGKPASVIVPGDFEAHGIEYIVAVLKQQKQTVKVSSSMDEAAKHFVSQSISNASLHVNILSFPLASQHADGLKNPNVHSTSQARATGGMLSHLPAALLQNVTTAGNSNRNRNTEVIAENIKRQSRYVLINNITKYLCSKEQLEELMRAKLFFQGSNSGFSHFKNQRAWEDFAKTYLVSRRQYFVITYVAY